MDERMSTMLELKGISKKYGTFYANKEINMSIQAGTVHCILGENGAGKSTLMNVLYGLTEPDEGEILINGAKVKINSPKDAISYGIGMVHQHFMLVPALTVLENIVLAMDEQKGFFINKKQVAENIKKISEKYGFQIDPYMKVADLSVGQQQRVEIVKAIYHECNLLILDEPTAVLTPTETEELYTIIEQFKKEQKSVIFISHKLHEVMHVSDIISVLRNGQNVATLNKLDTTEEELAAYMVGKQVNFVVKKEKAVPGDVVLDVDRLAVKGKKNTIAVKDLSLKVRAGEIYGIAGVDGNGQTELIEAISGLCKTQSGHIRIQNVDVTNEHPDVILEQGVAHIPADRQHVGILMQMSLLKNLILRDFNKKELKSGPFLNWKKQELHAKQMAEKYDVRSPRIDLEIGYLSGGNQQKAVVARELEQEPKLLLAVHPTRGVDIGAIEFIHKEIVKARDKGCAVLLISTELDEVMALGDRIGVMFEGKILGEMNREDATVEKIGMYMAGLSQ